MTKHLINGKPVTDIKPEPDNKTLIIEDWILEKEYLPAGVWSHDKGYTGGYIQDYKYAQKSYRVVGTEKQIADWAAAEDFILDEVYGYEPVAKDSYWDGIVCGERADRPTREEYNNKYKTDLERYTEMYKENNNKVLILRTN